MREFQEIKIGQVIPKFIGHAEGTLFNFDSSGANMIVFFNNPMPDEIAQFESRKKFEMRMIELSGIIFITAKIGNLDWMDFPYSPHLSKERPIFKDIRPGMGYSITLMLVNSQNGKLEHLRFIGMSEHFSKAFKNVAEGALRKPFDKNSYNMNLNTLFARYTTKQIVNMSSHYFKIN